MQNHNDDTRRATQFFRKIYLSLYLKGFERVTKGFTVRGSWRPNRTATYWPSSSSGHSSVSFSFSWVAQPKARGPSFLLSAVLSTASYLQLIDLQLVWSPCATAQLGAWGPTLLGAGFLYRILSPTDRTSCAPSYIIVRRPPSCGRHKLHSFNPSTVKVIFWYSSTGGTCYLHRCISYFDSPARSEANIQHNDQTVLFQTIQFSSS